MQNTIVYIILVIAAVYLGCRLYRRLRGSGSGGCGCTCSGGCQDRRRGCAQR